MTDERRKLARELLAAATQGPWGWGVHRVYVADQNGEPAQRTGMRPAGDHFPHVATAPRSHDAEFIAAAPELLREALDELDRREREDRDMATRLDEAGL